MTRLFDRIAADELALGVWTKGAPHLCSTLAKAGFDFVRPDMMFSSVDWKELDHVLRAAQVADLTCMVRIPSNPWVAGQSAMQVTVDAARAFSLGMPMVDVSVAGVEQVAACLEVAKDWHRSGAGEYPTTDEEFEAQGSRAALEAWVVPSIESRGAIDEIDQILDLEGLHGILIACTDFSKVLGHPFEYDHPEVWAVMDDIIGKARERGITVMANTGYLYNNPSLIIERTAKLYEHGVRVVMIQGAEFLLEMLTRDLLRDIRREVN